MLSKEQGVTALGVCAVYDVLLHWKIVRHRLSLWKKTPGSRTGGEGEGVSGTQYDSCGLVGGGETGGKNGQRSRGKGRLRQLGSPEPDEEMETLWRLIERVG